MGDVNTVTISIEEYNFFKDVRDNFQKWVEGECIIIKFSYDQYYVSKNLQPIADIIIKLQSIVSDLESELETEKAKKKWRVVI